MPLPSLLSPLAIAPMIDWTYVHFRVFMRMLAPHALLYTEMQTIGAIDHNPARALQFHASEPPLLALQVGGAEINGLVRVAKLAESSGFSEINLNLGCPSDKVQAGRFGACLMREATHVAECMAAMKQAVNIPVTAKTRIGIDDEDSYEHFESFVQALVQAGCDKLIVHARKAWLHGLSPKQNRTIPPVRYDFVYRVKETLPFIPVVVNGNIQTMDEIRVHLQQTDGVMLGRLACQDPYAIAQIHHALYPETPLLSRAAYLQQYVDYLLTLPVGPHSNALLFKPILNLAHALPGARTWKSKLTSIREGLNRAALADVILCLMQREENAASSTGMHGISF
jgi:tRNA-dihydrouridine synthase A